MTLSQYSIEDLQKELSNRKNHSGNYLITFITPKYLEMIPIIGRMKDVSIYKECLIKSRKSEYHNGNNLLYDIDDLNNYPELLFHRRKYLDILVDYILFYSSSFFNRELFESKFVIFNFEKDFDKVKYSFSKFNIQGI